MLNCPQFMQLLYSLLTVAESHSIAVSHTYNNVQSTCCKITFQSNASNQYERLSGKRLNCLHAVASFYMTCHSGKFIIVFLYQFLPSPAVKFKKLIFTIVATATFVGTLTLVCIKKPKIASATILNPLNCNLEGEGDY